MKRGFTVVELLASLIIMSLIIIIAFPMFNGISDKINEQNYNSKITMMTKSTKAFVDRYHKDLVFDGNIKEICYTINYLIEKNVFTSDNKEEIEIKDPIHGGNLNGYLVATYDITEYEVVVNYKESSYSGCNEDNIYDEDDL